MLRAPSASISGPHIRKTKLTPYQRGFMIGAHAAGVSPGRIHQLSILLDSTESITVNKSAE